jgi:hypothetical protein
MSWTAPPAAADRFVLIIDGLCRVVAARHGRGLAGPLIVLIWGRLRRLAARFAVLAAHVRAGTLPATRRRATPRPAAAPRAFVAPPRTPRGFAWLVRLVPEAAPYGEVLRHLLDDPEMAALLEAAPRMGRLLRPLCRMLGAAPPGGTLPPPLGQRSPRKPRRPRRPKPLDPMVAWGPRLSLARRRVPWPPVGSGRPAGA